ncbi:MAG: DUF1501 domain-containing protein [Gemmataceae bacterium]|nr:DUF1501 domain-containing protein [Gemmataceae bacterium]
MRPESSTAGYLHRRRWLWAAGLGFGALASAALAAPSGFTRDLAAVSAPLSHLKPRAKRVIFLFMEGGPSHLDLLDPKPLLNQLAGKKLPASFGTPVTSMGTAEAPLLECKRKWSRHGKGGLWFSDWIPHMAQRADDLLVLRGLWCDAINHSAGVCQMNTGSPLAGRPSLGAWTLYGLGSEADNLPGYVVLTDGSAAVTNGPRNWGAGFMPSLYQGTKLENGPKPLPGLEPDPAITPDQSTRRRRLLAGLNQAHLQARAEKDELAARIASQELAYRLQAEAPEAVDLAGETEATKRLYGIDRKTTANFGKMCLLARRLAERGVRFIQLYSGAGSRWDAHANIEKNHEIMCAGVDLPIAGLLTDLKQRGLLDDTLVIWGGEFGRTPMSEKGDGRDHNPWGFSMWMAGAGLKGGRTVGETDELGLRAINDNRMHVRDLHATILHLLGLDHTRVIFRHKGRPERPTINEGEVNQAVLT